MFVSGHYPIHVGLYLQRQPAPTVLMAHGLFVYGLTLARLQLPLIGDSTYRSYQASLVRDDGKVIRTWKNRGARVLGFGQAIEINVRGDLLERQQRYRVLLRGISSDGSVHDFSSYYFQVAN